MAAGDRVRARQLAEDAEAVLSASSEPPPILDELRTWLDEHEPPASIPLPLALARA